MNRIALIAAMACLAATAMETSHAQDIRVPTSATAGEDAAIQAAGSGKATFYLVGPGTSRKSDVSLGEEVHLKGQDLRNAGSYLAIICSSSCGSANFYVTAAKPAKLTFLVHPSRVPVSLSDAVSGVALPFDQFQNLVLAPVTVNFQLTAGNTSSFSRQAHTQDGVAWFRTASGKSAGAVQAISSLDD